MNDLETIRVTFTCAHCGSLNELTAAHVHETMVIHCSRCAGSVAPLAALEHRTSPPAAASSPEAALPRP